MGKIIKAMSASAFVVSVLAFSGSMQPGEAAVIYPWCAHYGGRDGGVSSCGSSTYAQCMATVSGMQGFCAVNPWYQEPAPAALKRPKKQVRG